MEFNSLFIGSYWALLIFVSLLVGVGGVYGIIKFIELLGSL